jgi:hypothetical protein
MQGQQQQQRRQHPFHQQNQEFHRRAWEQQQRNQQEYNRRRQETLLAAKYRKAQERVSGRYTYMYRLDQAQTTMRLCALLVTPSPTKHNQHNDDDEAGREPAPTDYGRRPATSRVTPSLTFRSHPCPSPLSLQVLWVNSLSHLRNVALDSEGTVRHQPPCSHGCLSNKAPC